MMLLIVVLLGLVNMPLGGLCSDLNELTPVNGKKMTRLLTMEIKGAINSGDWVQFLQVHSKKQIQQLDHFSECYNHFTSTLQFQVGCWAMEPECFDFFKERADELNKNHHFQNSRGVEKSCKKVLQEAAQLDKKIIHLRDESEKEYVMRCLNSANQMLSTLPQFPKEWPSNSVKEYSDLKRFMENYVKFFGNKEYDCSVLKFDVTKMA